MSIELEQAYLKTHYRVQAGRFELCFRIGQYDAQAEAQLAECCGHFRQWAILTPCNPASVALCEPENAARAENLRRWLSSEGYRWLPSNNHDPALAWPDEPGALILDIPLPEARRLGCTQGQNALVYAQRCNPPELIWLRDC